MKQIGFRGVRAFKHGLTAWKVSKYGNLVRIFLYLDCIQSEYRKIRIRKNSVFGLFSRSEYELNQSGVRNLPFLTLDKVFLFISLLNYQLTYQPNMLIDLINFMKKSSADNCLLYPRMLQSLALSNVRPYFKVHLHILIWNMMLEMQQSI